MPPDTIALAPTRTKHRPRFRRAASEDRPAFRLTDRDRVLLKLIYEYRFITAPMLQDLAPAVELTENQQSALDRLRAAKKAAGLGMESLERPQRSRRAILRRLQMLYHGGFVQRRKLSDRDPIVYSLGNLGADELTLHFGIDRQEIDWTTKSRETSERYMAHGLLVSRFRHALEQAVRDVPDVHLEFWKPSGAFKAKVAYQDAVKTREGTRTELVERTIIPDGVFAVTAENKKIYYFLEADRSKMSNAKFLRKLKSYYAFWATYVRDPKKPSPIKQMRVITLTISEARKDNLRKTAQKVSPEAKNLFWFLCEKAYLGTPQEILKGNWQTLEDDALRSLYTHG